MNTQIHNFNYKFTFKLIPKLAPSIRYILEKIAILLIPLPLFMLFLGTEGIIEKDSPDSLATIGSMGSSFFNFFEMHTLIIAGAFGITFIIWFITRNIWNQSAEEFEETQDYCEDTDYTETVDENNTENSAHLCDLEESIPQILQKKKTS